MPHRSDHRERRRLRTQAAGVGFSESDFLELSYPIDQTSLKSCESLFYGKKEISMKK